MMPKFNERLKVLRTERDLSQQALANMIKISKSSINMYERGEREPSLEMLENLADFFNVDLDYLLGKSEHRNKNAWLFEQSLSDVEFTPKSKGVKIPVLGNVAAGVPLGAVTDILDYEEISEDMAKTGEFFALRIKGDSMEPKISDGDVVVVRQQQNVESGQIAIVLVNGDDATCKKFIKHDTGISLVSLNPSFPPMFYTADEVEKKPVRIIGRVVELRAKF